MEFIEKLNVVKRNIEKCERVTKHSTNEESQVDTLANALLDIDESIQILKEQISKLYLNDLAKDDVEDLILDIGEELRHIIYHINDTRVYDYLR
jgi:hypothetical protein